MTRTDEGVGQGTYDSIAWIFETHLKTPDTREFNAAIVKGNEDCPDTIQLWHEANPNFGQRPDAVYFLNSDREYSRLYYNPQD